MNGNMKILLAALLCALSVPAQSADPYPVRPIRLIVGFSAGGSTDYLAREVGQELSTRLGQQVVVDNRPGAGTMIAAEAVAKSPADGYTLMYGTPSTIIAPLLQKTSTLQIPKDLVPVSIVTVQPMGIMVSPETGIATMRDLVRYAKENPGKINFASSGIGTSEHLVVEALSAKLGIRLTHIPYKGANPALTDLLAGRVQMMVNSLYGPPLDHIRSGKIRLIALTGPQRNPQFPDVPSMTEGGLTDFSFQTWTGLLAPPNLPPHVVETLVRAIKEIERDGRFQKAIEGQAMSVRPMAAQAARDFVVRQGIFFNEVIDKNNIKTD
jgi:tripartite-type tricarboxylate transporter receptor subunit TctC